jgi:hypothetical protein
MNHQLEDVLKFTLVSHAIYNRTLLKPELEVMRLSFLKFNEIILGLRYRFILLIYAIDLRY